jgi:hypothetical protein
MKSPVTRECAKVTGKAQKILFVSATASGHAVTGVFSSADLRY